MVRGGAAPVVTNIGAAALLTLIGEGSGGRWKPVYIPRESNQYLSQPHNRHTMFQRNANVYVVLEGGKMSNWEDTIYCAYLGCHADLLSGCSQFCPHHDRINREAFKAKVDDRNPKTKTRLFRAQNGLCNYCGRELDLEFLVFEHLLPVSKYGSSIVGNMQLTCQPCNSRKNSRTDRDFRDDNSNMLPRQARKPANPFIKSADLRTVRARLPRITERSI